MIGLGEEILRGGAVSDAKNERVAEHVSEFAALARAMGVQSLEAVLTAPGREATNAPVLAATIGHAAAASTRTLSVDDLGVLAFSGAILGNRARGDSVAVCDVGAMSTVITIGTRDGGPAYVRAIPMGSLTLRTHLGREMPSAAAIGAARDAVESAFAGVVMPLPKVVLATGGAARSLRKLVGRSIDNDAADAAIRLARRCEAAEIVNIHGIPPHRAETLAADGLILNEVHRRLAIPLDVSATGHREGYAARLAAESVEAA
jgi:exopolyphosphatase/pppGpp-phosphohydrolase